MQNSEDHDWYRAGINPGQVPTRTFRYRKAGSRFADRLAGVFEQEALTDRDFIPIGKLDELVTQTSVNQELARIEYLPAYVRHRLWRKTRPLIVIPSRQHGNGGAMSRQTENNFQKIFAILVWIRCPDRIWAFVKEEVHDGDLPLRLEHISTSQGIVESLRRKTGSPADLTCLKARRDIREFVNHQWFVLAPSFNPSEMTPVPRLIVSKGQILPFLDWDNKIQQGGSGEVSKVTIHQDHHSFTAQQVPNNVIAIKKIHHLHKDSFDREYNILRHLRKMEHANEHLVTLLAAYNQNDHFYLLLPWAEFDLYRYWHEKSPEAPYGDPRVSSWIHRQCCGLTGAVSTIHHYLTSSKTSILRDEYSMQPGSTQSTGKNHDQVDDAKVRLTLKGRHGDIKPHNILWYPEQNGLGVLRLSDFGTAHFSSANRKSCYQRDKMPSSWTYRSPESILPDGEVSGQCDVWALGCVFLEFVCWYAGGCELLKQFEDDRASGHESISFCYPKYNGRGKRTCMAIKEAVQEMFTKLQEKGQIQSDQGMKGLINTIQKDMLVISKGRKSTGNIHRDLGSVPETSEYLHNS
ncbi:kinase-like domain-containing protein [Phaeosphaeria sp. MPI-PUGE-AT-0046c]|nr:kinase-like domain-containing protein [Phaeosphaeria sp. MPI-PUGE-AT-0046c]